MSRILKMLILPRQARDKHKENSKKDAFLQEEVVRMLEEIHEGEGQAEHLRLMVARARAIQCTVRKTPFLWCFLLYIKTIILPRQARDDIAGRS